VISHIDSWYVCVCVHARAWCFPGDQNRPFDETKWYLQSGGEKTDKCGTVLSGKAMHFHGKGERVLQTTDLDLKHAT